MAGPVVGIAEGGRVGEAVGMTPQHTTAILRFGFSLTALFSKS